MLAVADKDQANLPEAPTKPARRAIALQHRDEILLRMAKGEPITKIAHDLGYADHSGIIHRLEDDPDYKAALRTGIVGKLEKREQDLEAAQDNVTVTRAERLLGHARWWAERLDPQRWGQLNKLQVEHVDDLGERLRRARSRVIDVAPEQQRSAQEAETLPVISGTPLNNAQEADK